jgi:hypothetical protein
VTRTTEALERDLAALIKRVNDPRRDSAELNWTAEDLLEKAAPLLKRNDDRLKGEAR